MSYEAKLIELGIELPAAPAPVATYVPSVQAGDLLFLSGVLPMREGKPAMTGKLGAPLTVEQGYEASRIAVLNALAIARTRLGTLDRVQQIVKLVGHVASADGFSQQPPVINGASDLLVAIFGDAGRHARVAVGCAMLPLNAPVELELIIQVRT
ncbi:MAG TPA: RidA family protein [Nitrospirales bacterium]|nr:RidA family protein [Nitrospirales bacterium]